MAEITLESLNTRIDKMSQWAKQMEQQLNGVPDAAALWAEADEITAQYRDVPARICKLEQSKATLEASIVTLRESLELIEANLSLECDGKNAEQRKAQLRLALANDETAIPLAKELADKELSVKLLDVEIQEKERVWSDYHRRVIILASKAGVSYR